MIIKHKGYTLVQEEVSFHYSIFDENGNGHLHGTYDKVMTEQEAKERIELHIRLSEKFDAIWEDEMDGEKNDG